MRRGRGVRHRAHVVVDDIEVVVDHIATTEDILAIDKGARCALSLNKLGLLVQAAATCRLLCAPYKLTLSYLVRLTYALHVLSLILSTKVP